MNSERDQIETEARVKTRNIRIVRENPEREIVEGLRPGLKFGFSFGIRSED